MSDSYAKSISSKRLTKETFIYLPVFLIPALINIVTLSLFTRFFPPKLYGEYSLVVNTAIIISSLMGQWVVLSIQRFRPEYRSNDNLHVFNHFLNRLLLQMTMTWIVFSFLIAFFIPNTYKDYFLPSVISVIGSVYFMVLSSVYQIDLLSQRFRNLNVFQALGKLPITILLLYLVSFTPQQFIWGTVIMQLVILIPMLKYMETGTFIKSFQKTDPRQYQDFIRSFFTYGFPLIGWYIGTTILNLTDRYMIQWFRGAHEVGIYSANFTIAVQALALICNAFFFAIQPIVMNQVDADREKTQESISKYTKIYMLLAVPFGIYFSVFRNEVSSFLLGEEFVTGAAIIPILIAGFFFWNLGLYGQLCYQIDKRTKPMFYFVTIAAIVNILLNFYFIPNFGFIGAAISTGVGFFVYTMLIYFSTMKHTKWKIPWHSFFKIGIVGFIIGLPLEYIRHHWFVDVNPLMTMVIGLIYFPLYVMVIIILREISISPIVAMLKNRR